MHKYFYKLLRAFKSFYAPCRGRSVGGLLGFKMAVRAFKMVVRAFKMAVRAFKMVYFKLSHI